MKKIFLMALLCASLFFLLSMSRIPNGTILSQESFKPFGDEPQECLDWYAKVNDAEFFKITYAVDGLKVTGLLAKAKRLSSKKNPVLIYNRGGNREFSKNNTCTLLDIFYPLIKKGGLVILASQYRGVDGGDGADEFGGADVNDVLALVKTAKSLPYADPKNIFMLGWSRGSINTYRAIQGNSEIRAAAVVGGVSDLFQLLKERPEMEAILKATIPHFSAARETELLKRSALFWADKISVPVFLLHGDQDPRVNVQDAYAMDNALTRANRPHRLKIYSGSGHFLFNDKVIDEILDWFEQYI